MPVLRLMPGWGKPSHYMSQARNEAKWSGWACPSQDNSQILKDQGDSTLNSNSVTIF